MTKREAARTTPVCRCEEENRLCVKYTEINGRAFLYFFFENDLYFLLWERVMSSNKKRNRKNNTS